MPKKTAKTEKSSSDGSNIQESLDRLEELASWFEKESDFDVEEGLKKVKEGVVLVKDLRERLKEIENEFREVQAELKEE